MVIEAGLQIDFTGLQSATRYDIRADGILLSYIASKINYDTFRDIYIISGEVWLDN